MKNVLWFWLVLCILIFPLSAGAVGNSGKKSGPREPYDESYNDPGQRIVTGTIDQITNSKISVKTDGGRTRVFTIDPSEQSDYVNRGLKKGDRISLSYNHQNQIIGVDKVQME